MDNETDRSETQKSLVKRNSGNMDESNHKRSKLNVYIAACVCNLCSFAAGNTLTWSSPTIAKLQDIDQIDETQISWVGSLIALGASVGPFIAGALIDRVGRKPTLMLTSAFFLLSWAMIGTSFCMSEINYPLIYVARLIAGMSCGIVYTAIPIYIGEIAEDSIRSSLGTIMAMFLIAGFLMEFVIGPHISFLQLILASSVASVVFAVSFYFMPESPYYLLMKNNKAKALRALQWVRGASNATHVQKELSQIQAAVNEAASMKSGITELVATKGNIKALYLSCGFAGFQQLSGINVILFYSESIFKMTGADLSPSNCSIIVGSVMLFSSVLASPLARYFSMKLLFIVSAIGMAISQSILGLYFYLMSHSYDVSALSLLPVTCVVVYIITYCFGFGPLPWAVVGEMFPANVKATGSAITASYCWILGFIVTKSFTSIILTLGTDIGFWIFTVFCIIALIFTILLLPNTKGMSLQQIQDLLNGRAVEIS